jgi:hypothetical protein
VVRVGRKRQGQPDVGIKEHGPGAGGLPG